ncbi:MAG: FtsX-like permease family protein [Dehalococcoidales bacterium]
MLSPRWRKVVRDLWGNKTRTVLVVMAIAVGIFAFGSSFITQEMLVASMDGQYQAIDASTITMYMGSFDDGLVRWAKRQKEVRDAQGRVVYSVKLIKENQRYNLNLYTYDDYENIRLNRISSETGAWPPGRQEILFERSSFAPSGAQIGDEIVIELSSGREYELTVVGTVHDLNVVPANLSPQLTGYVSMKTLDWLGLPSTYNRLEIVARDEFDTVAKLEKVADELEVRLQSNGISVGAIVVSKPGEHWAKDTTESFSIILNFIGIFSLLLSSFLVVNTISAMLTQQRRQVGIMKAIGATGRQIIGLYLVLVIFYGLLSLMVALPVGMGLAYVFTLSVTQFLNIDIVVFYLPKSVFILQVVAALVVPVVASLIPVLGGVRITVQKAINSSGIEEKSKQGLLDRLLLRVRGLPRPVLLSIRNTFRRKARLALTLSTLILAGALFMTVVNVRGSMIAEFDTLLTEYFGYQVMLSLDGNYPSQGIVRRAQRVPGVTQAEGRTGMQVQYIKPDGTKGATFSIAGIPYDSDFIQPTLVSGRWLQSTDRNTIVLSSSLVADMPGVQVGDEIILDRGGNERIWEVVGIILMEIDRVSYTDFNYLSSIKGATGLASNMLIRIEEKDGQSQTIMAEAIEKHLKESGIKIDRTMTVDAISSSWAGQVDFLIGFLLTMAAMSAMIGGLGLAGIMSLNVMERTREIGVMRSIGASGRAIGGIVVTEGLLIGIISLVLAIPVSIPMSLLFSSMMGQLFFGKPMVFIFSLFGLITWFVIVIFISVIASLLPAYRAMKMSVQETLAYE